MRRAVFLHHMIVDVNEYMLSGLTGNSDIARILSERYGMAVTSDDVARWKRQHPRFAQACLNAVDNMDAMAVGVVASHIRDNDVTTAKWWLERRNDRFKPKTAMEHSGRVEGLGEMLARRTTEEELRAQGVLYDEDGSDDDDDDDDE